MFHVICRLLVLNSFTTICPRFEVHLSPVRGDLHILKRSCFRVAQCDCSAAELSLRVLPGRLGPPYALFPSFPLEYPKSGAWLLLVSSHISCHCFMVPQWNETACDLAITRSNPAWANLSEDESQSKDLKLGRCKYCSVIWRVGTNGWRGHHENSNNIA